ncbi:MAG: DUF2332 family protein [Solirubrobacterales bacterium]|nr:DUF2332 family protein [Solirubrobacterales bacterium]
MDVRARIAAEYRRFGEIDARPRSPFYDRVAHAVAEDHRILGLLAAMPVAKQQPNLLFGAVRYLYGTPATPEEFLALVHEHSHEILGVMATRTTQTNEPARCSTLLPALALLSPPLALLEVGASAGLCLLPDRYEFDYGARRIPASEYLGTDPPVFWCSPGAQTPLPRHNLDVVWRAGLDLNPIDLRDPREVQWLEALVWPGEEYRIPRLRAACEIARRDPPRVLVGDLRNDLRRLRRGRRRRRRSWCSTPPS